MGAENESTSRCDTAFSILFWERTAKSIRTVQWRIRGEQSANGARSACGTGTEKRKFGGEAAELIPFASWAQSSAVFPGQKRIWGFLLRYFTIKRLFLVIYIKRKIDPSILSDFYFYIEKRIYFIQRLIQRTVLSPPPLMKGLCCNGWQRVRSTRSTGVIR